MTLTVDSREQSSILKEGCDIVGPLPYGDRGYSYDVLIERQSPPLSLKGERKTWSDFVQSWLAKKLERQAGAVDFLIVELPDSVERRGWDRKEAELNHRAFRHLSRMSFNMPVIPSFGEEQTIEIYRYLESAPTFTLRENKTVKQSDDFYDSVITLLGMNPDRIMATGETVRATLMRFVDKQLAAKALGLTKWHKIPGVGVKTIRRAASRVLSGR